MVLSFFHRNAMTWFKINDKSSYFCILNFLRNEKSRNCFILMCMARLSSQYSNNLNIQSITFFLPYFLFPFCSCFVLLLYFSFCFYSFLYLFLLFYIYVFSSSFFYFVLFILYAFYIFYIYSIFFFVSRGIFYFLSN